MQFHLSDYNYMGFNLQNIQNNKRFNVQFSKYLNMNDWVIHCKYDKCQKMPKSIRDVFHQNSKVS